MNAEPDRWRRVKALFGDAIARPEPDRSRWLADACAGDADLRREVESLLDASERAGDVFERGAAGVTTLAAAGVPMPDDALPHLVQGDRLGPYEIVGLVGRGGMGEVYRARDVRLDRIVALKVLPPLAAHHPQARQRLEREARTVSRLSHPNICALFDVDLQGDVAFLVMEFLEGETLAARLERGPLPPDELFKTALAIADALDCAHRQGIVHRDLKPSNVVLANEPGAKLLDFGIAKLRDSDARAFAGTGIAAAPSDTLTRDGQIAGTIAYMSPEQLRGEEADERSDLFSFGALLYEMATGRRPFLELRTRMLINEILTITPPSIETVIPGRLPPGLARVVERALQQDPRQRYQHASEMRADIRRLPAPDAHAAPHWNARRLAAAAAVLTTAIALGAWFQTRRAPSAAHAPLRSVTVLPFKPLVPGSEQSYVGASLAEALITELSAIQTLAVRRTGTDNRYSRPGADPVAAGRELGVDLVLDGAIQRDGAQLRVNAYLVRTADGATVWSDRFDAPWDDVFRVQDKIAEQVTRALAVTLTGEDQRRLTRRRTTSVDAYEAYLKGRYFWNLRNADGFQKALDYFQQAIDKDPGYAPAYAGLADTYALLGSFPYAIMPATEAAPKAKAAAVKALSIDETLAEAHVSLAFVSYGFDWDWAAGERGFRRAIELNPEYAPAHYWYAFFLGQLGRIDEAVAEGQRAVQAEPLSMVGTYVVGLSNYFGRRFGAARRYAEKALEITPDFAPGRRLLGSVDVAEGRYADAVREFRRLHDVAPNNSLHAGLLAHAYGRAGQVAEARALLDGLKREASRRFVSPANVGLGYVGTGETDAAFEWLEKAFLEHSQAMPFLKNEPLYDALRGDPRFADLLRRIGLDAPR